MEKALHRQRILLQHLQPSSSQTSDSPAISVSSRRSFFFNFYYSLYLFIYLISFIFGFLLSSKASICSAGEAAGYHRKPAFDDDVVIVA